MAKLERRLAGWKSNLLSMGGWVTLIKSVLACLPVYFMSLFQIPITIKDKLDKIQRKFLWGGTCSSRKIHWVDWNSVCNLKINGGLGIGDVGTKNRALLNKWVWRYGEEPRAMWKAIIDSKYGGDQYDLIPSLRHQRRFSGLWKNITKIMGSQDFPLNGSSPCIGYSLGDGNCIQFWKDEWIEDVVLKDAFPRIFALAVNKSGKVKEFGVWSNNVWHWEVSLRRRLFGWELQQWSNLLSTLKRFVVYDSFKDFFVWKGSPSGKYSVNLYFKFVLRPTNMNKEIWKFVWMGFAPPKVKVFCWQLMKDRIAIKEQLARRRLLD